MTEPAGRITPLTNYELWKRLHDQWVLERKPAYVVQNAGAITYRYVQLTSGSDAFDPMLNEVMRDSTGFPQG